MTSAEKAATAASAANETNVFAQPERVTNKQAVLVDAVHDAYLRLTPLLSDSSRLLHGWTDDRVETGIHRLRDAVATAKATARGDAAPTTECDSINEPSTTTGAGTMTLDLADSLRRVEQLHARLIDLALVLEDHAVRSERSRAGTPRSRPRLLRRG